MNIKSLSLEELKAISGGNQSCPPGLAKKQPACEPPGQAKKLGDA